MCGSGSIDYNEVRERGKKKTTTKGERVLVKVLGWEERRTHKMQKLRVESTDVHVPGGVERSPRLITVGASSEDSETGLGGS